jgi:hypothetical protein
MACAIGSSQIHAFGATRELVRRWWQPKKPTASRLIDTWREFSGVCGNGHWSGSPRTASTCRRCTDFDRHAEILDRSFHENFGLDRRAWSGAAVREALKMALCKERRAGAP